MDAETALSQPLQELMLPALDDPQRNPSKIDEKRVQQLCQLACDRIQSCRTDMGLDVYSYGGTYTLVPSGRVNTWIHSRQCSRFEYAGDFLHRRALGGIFMENNWTLATSGRFVRLLAAKHADDLVGSDPFFAAMPEKIDNPDQIVLAKQTEGYVQDEIGRSNLGSVLAESIRVALVEGERAVKLTYQKDETQYPGDATVMVDDKGEPMMTAKGHYVYENDATIDVFVDQMGNFVKAVDPKTDLDPQTGQLITPPGLTLQSRLEREPTFIFPPEPKFKFIEDLMITIEHRNGLVADGLFAEDFIYPIFVPRLELADIMAHVYDAPIEELASRYPDYYQKLQKMGESAKYIAIGATGALSAEGQPQMTSGEVSRADNSRRLINIHETYYRCRVNPKDTKDSWLFMVLDYQNKIPIFVEYLGRMNMKRPPFGLIRGIESVPGRAYGVGVFEKFRDRNLAIDLWFNRLALKSSKSGSVTCYYPDAFEETNDGEELVIGDTRAYRVRANEAGEKPYGPDHPPVFRLNLNEVDEYTMEILEKMVQSGEVEFGIFSAADGSANDLNASGTATGIRNIERTGNVIQRATEDMMAGDITGLLEMAVDIILENMDQEEAKWIPGENKLATLNKDEIRNLPRNVRLLLSKSQAQEGINNAEQIKDTIIQYYGLAPALQKHVRSTFIQILKMLDVADADDILHDPSEEEIEAYVQSQQGQPKISDALSFKGTDLAQNQKDAALQKDFGLPAATGPVQSTPQLAMGQPPVALPPPANPMPAATPQAA